MFTHPNDKGEIDIELFINYIRNLGRKIEGEQDEEFLTHAQEFNE